MTMKRMVRGGLVCFRLARSHGLQRAVQHVGTRLRGLLNDENRARINALQCKVDQLEKTVVLHSESVRALTQAHARLCSSLPDCSRLSTEAAAPLVSVIMPTWNRRTLIGAAIQSVVEQSYPHWELLVIDDGSSDGTAALVRSYADPRIRYTCQPHQGHARARNLGLAQSRGELIAYLDSDNTWYPHYLDTVVATLLRNPQQEAVYLHRLIEESAPSRVFVRASTFDPAQPEHDNRVDLNVFAHRKRLTDRVGGFDELLTRSSDRDLFLRCLDVTKPLAVSEIGCLYRKHGGARVSTSESFQRNDYRIQRKREQRIGRPLRVLYALSQFPQLTETYIRWEMAYMRRRGVHVEVWTQKEPPSPYATDVPIHRGTLDEAIRQVQPGLVHVHFGHSAAALVPAVARAGLPMTVRGHSFEHKPAVIETLLREPSVRRLYLFPHFAAAVGPNDKVRPTNAAMNGELHRVSPAKDPRLVLRTAAASAAKGLEAFFQTARLCPEFRFILALGLGKEKELRRLEELNRSLGCPVDLRVNVPTEAVAELLAEAGIYLHTHGRASHPFGMPISIAEALASGCYVLARRCPAAAAYLGSSDQLYDSAAEAAALIRATTAWSQAQWQQLRLCAVDRAYGNFADTVVLAAMLDDWLDLTCASHHQPLRPAYAARPAA